MENRNMSKQPVGVTILGVLAAVAAGVNLYHTLQFLSILPAMLGPFRFFGQNFWGAMIFGFNTVLWAVVAWGLLSLKPWAWLFTIVVAVLGLLSTALGLLGGSELSAMLPALVIDTIILIYCLTPGVKQAFGRA
jgi:hypothetical protein